MTTYDPALCEQYARELRTSGGSGLTPRAQRELAMADQLEAAKCEVERLTGCSKSWAQHAASIIAERDALRSELDSERRLFVADVLRHDAVRDKFTEELMSVTAERDALRESVHVLTAATRADQLRVELACEERDKISAELATSRGVIDSGNEAFRQLRDQWAAERDALRADLTQATSERDIARSRLDMSESYGRDKDARIAALEAGLRTACDLLDEWIECHTALDSCEDEDDWATSTRLRVLADTTRE